jgi:hypothetical protein
MPSGHIWYHPLPGSRSSRRAAAAHATHPHTLRPHTPLLPVPAPCVPAATPSPSLLAQVQIPWPALPRIPVELSSGSGGRTWCVLGGLHLATLLKVGGEVEAALRVLDDAAEAAPATELPCRSSWPASPRTTSPGNSPSSSLPCRFSVSCLRSASAQPVKHQSGVLVWHTADL